ncbi:hypothetical protein F4553_008048 [Allocatelliglobosispora scoriae]|uniref:Uncharacterized protein n=1 Tax=Allocatelliglobosispora scoriae TaxID=643052 RepID=A0A841C2N0_9ACTN|nr:hypothetical protein [Allocatelliglobosispora scoriae]MBB5874614.1 hypothetical protein [Allocatelliglobosispora scoriae]
MASPGVVTQPAPARGLRHHLGAVVSGLVVAVLTASSAPWWWPMLFPGSSSALTVTGFSGGCAAFRVHAQNRWEPYGTRKLVAPDILARQVGGYAPNQVIAVNGWVHGSVAYPFNPPPFNNDVWYHTADDTGWVSFAGVRNVPTEQDPSGHSPDGGAPVPVAAACEGSIH